MNPLAKLLGRATKDTVTWIESDELVNLLNNRMPPLVVDVRRPDEFIGPLGHIESARNIPLDQIPSHTPRLLEEQHHVVFVCHTDRRSAAAAEHLRRAGGSEIGILRGGMVAWRSRPGR